MKLFPDDPGLDLLTLGHWESKREWKRGLECLERFDHFIGGDPYLNTYRTIFLIKLGRTTEAKVSARQLLAAEPKLEGSFYTMAYYLVMTKDYAGAVENYKQVVTKLGRSLALEQLLTDPDYSVFVKSKEYADLKKWAEARSK